jgi:hypothetical protein
MESMLISSNKIDRKYRAALAKTYFYLARNMDAIDSKQARDLAAHASQLDPNFHPNQNKIYDWLFNSFGFRTAEFVSKLKRRIRIGGVRLSAQPAQANSCESSTK